LAAQFSLGNVETSFYNL